MTTQRILALDRYLTEEESRQGCGYSLIHLIDRDDKNKAFFSNLRRFIGREFLSKPIPTKTLLSSTNIQQREHP